MIPGKKQVMEHLNNFNIIDGIQNSTALLKSKDILLLVQHLKAVKCVTTVIICVDPDIEMQSICPIESSLLDHIQKMDHYIILVLTTTVVNKDRNFRRRMVLTV